MTQRVLWRHHTESQTNDHNIVDRKRQRRIEEEIDFQRIRGLKFSDILKDKSNSAYYDESNPSLVIKIPDQSTLVQIISEHMIVGQKVALNLSLLALHRELNILLLPPTSVFISNMVTLISYASLRRNGIVHHYTSSMCKGSFTITVVLSLIVLIQLSTFERVLFGSIMLAVCLLSPCIQWRLQKHRKIITGPWEIDHIST